MLILCWLNVPYGLLQYHYFQFYCITTFPALKSIRLGAALKKKTWREEDVQQKCNKGRETKFKLRMLTEVLQTNWALQASKKFPRIQPPTRQYQSPTGPMHNRDTAKDKTHKTPRDKLVPQKNAQTINNFNEQTQPSKPPPPNCRNLTTGPFMFLNLSRHQIKRPYATRRLA